MTTKEKAYDEALERARQFSEHPLQEDSGTIVEYIFPELKESDDERIRKEIMQLIQCMHDADPRKERWTAWLEKQEVQKEDVHSKEFWGEIRKNLSDFLQEFCERGINTNFDRWTESDRVNWLLWLEKQGEQETDKWKEGNIIRHGGILALVIKGRRAMKSNGEIFTVQYPDEWVKASPNEIEHFLNELEKQGKQKSTDKVEPKFKVGDWIVNKGHSYLIADIDYLEHRYLFEIGGYTHEQLNWEYIELADKKYHLWTISDAKDGDVLSWDDSKCIVLFKNIYDEDSFNSYGFIGHCTGAFESRLSYHDIEGVHPATKEQRDLLFEKMHEAGYMWNKEKKKLTKIKDETSIAIKDSKAYRIGFTDGEAYAKEEMQSSWSEAMYNFVNKWKSGKFGEVPLQKALSTKFDDYFNSVLDKSK